MSGLSSIPVYCILATTVPLQLVYLHIKIFDEIIVNPDKKLVHSACQILFVYVSAAPLKIEEKLDVVEHAQKVDDFITGPVLFKRKLAKIQSLIIDLFHNGGLLTYYFYMYDD